MKKLMNFWQNGAKKDGEPDDKPTKDEDAKPEEKKVKDWKGFVPEKVDVVAPQVDPTKEKVELKVTSSKDPKSSDTLVHISVQSGPGTHRTPLDVCCVVDVSGSMSNNASIKNEDGQSEGHGLTILDVVKHSVKTIIHALEPCDRISVVAFESSPHLWFPLTQATDINKEYLDFKVDEMRTMGGTDLWKGLESGMDLLLGVPANERALRFPTLLVLTDGIPDYNPGAKLRDYKDKKQHLPNLNTFGFGYSLQTPVLLNIAQEGNGMHAFIPDASFVGTAFVNSISNLMVTNATNATLSVEPAGGLKIEQVLGHKSQATSWGHLIDICTLQYGQQKDSVLRVSLPTKEEGAPEPSLTVTLKYQSAIEPKEHVIEVQSNCTEEDGGVALQVHQLRLNMATELLKLQTDGSKEEAQAKLLESATGIEDPHAKGMYEDIKGQVKEAIQIQPQNFFQKWGVHYLPSLSRAHLLQQCNNFKDPGIQFYGGEIFQQLRDKIEDIFVKLPPPTPTGYSGYDSYGGGGSAPLASMSAYYNAAGGCIAGECVVSMADGSQKRVDQILKGDKVASSITGAGSSSEVVCVVRTHCHNGRESLVTLPSGLRLTPYHPVRKDDAWHFPLNLAVPHRDTRCDFVYNFVLRGEMHAMVVNGIECVTLGHGMEGDVIGHPYFGTQCVVDDLRKMRGFAQGCVELYPSVCGGKSMVRDEKTGLVCGFVQGVDVVPSGTCEL